ncbi:hypothetical protein [Agitococcus lubricus]|uniref:Ferredoxin-dependent bilin reductase n=1 Tax=Agitococcus lubricus TaxID=1077255 RepID=A0A2T5IZA9_9GAMM|nr:hypothetical protein [Agitococcus lubricus]PTQ89276.1 ferredoxin-dependent bilin reductase [Agitococcus lubricus]
MNSLFSHLIDELKTHPFFTPLSIPSDFQHKSIERAQGSLNLHSQAYLLKEYGELRSVVIQSSKIEIISCFFYPFAQWDLPIYAMEFVSLAKKPIVGVLDLPCLSGTAHLPAQAFMANLLAKYQFQLSTDYPDWYKECRSGYDIFTRPENHAVFERLSQAHRDILDEIPQFAAQASLLSAVDLNAHRQQIKSYQEHHLVNSPGLPLMNNLFGQAWTSAFLEEWFFAASTL